MMSQGTNGHEIGAYRYFVSMRTTEHERVALFHGKMCEERKKYDRI
jgi:hypothetical protein